MRLNIGPRDHYINNLFAPEDASLMAIRQALRNDEKEGINVGPYEGRLLQTLIAASGVRRVVELGTLYGYSTLWMARALPEGGEIHSIEFDEGNFKKAQSLLRDTECFNKIILHHGDALSVLPTLESSPFDMIFIDANKAGYLKYLDWAEAHIKPGGLIVGDNTFLFGHVIGEGNNSNMSENTIATMKQFNQRLANPEKYVSVLVPTQEGLTVAVKL
ncbi:MAG: O-methyltransferase [Pseudobdellovibrionaceae bacterium]|nr:O-methyltransferase [Bdellovibrionales bacterium]USN47179.1 MAG: O-methyltransferase [Pseudobdellovibrionaceae bacterium]